MPDAVVAIPTEHERARECRVGNAGAMSAGTCAPVSFYRVSALVHSADEGLLLRVATLLHRRRVAVTELTWHIRPNVAEDGELAGDVTVVFAASRQQAHVVLAGFVHMVGLLRPTLRDEPTR